MYLRDKRSDDLVEIMDMAAMVDPCMTELDGRLHAGEELQDVVRFAKDNLVFPSGEALPRCWLDATYRTAKQ